MGASSDTAFRVSASDLAWAMLPILVQHLPRDRERMGLRPVQMAGRLGLTVTEYRALEAGELHIDTKPGAVELPATQSCRRSG